MCIRPSLCGCCCVFILVVAVSAHWHVCLSCVAVWLCVCVCVCVSVSYCMYVPLCNHVAVTVDGAVVSMTVGVDERLLMCVAVIECLVAGGVTL